MSTKLVKNVTEIDLTSKEACINFLNHLITYDVYVKYWLDDNKSNHRFFELYDYEFLLTFSLFLIESEGY